jgi:hypothetical protein
MISYPTSFNYDRNLLIPVAVMHLICVQNYSIIVGTY